MGKQVQGQVALGHLWCHRHPRRDWTREGATAVRGCGTVVRGKGPSSMRNKWFNWNSCLRRVIIRIRTPEQTWAGRHSCQSQEYKSGFRIDVQKLVTLMRYWSNRLRFFFSQFAQRCWTNPSKNLERFFTKTDAFNKNLSKTIGSSNIGTVNISWLKLMRLDLNKTSTFSTKNFVIFTLDKNSKNKIFSEILEDYNGVCLKKFPVNAAKTIKCVFGKIFYFFENFINLKVTYGI